MTECFASRKRVFGEKHLSTQHTAASLGGVYLYQGRKKEAEEILLKAIDGGTDDPAQIPLHSLQTANLLACTYRDLREYDKAEVLFKRIIAVAERYRGQDNLHVVSFMHNLATVYTAQKKFANAEALFMKCLDISRTQLTADHPETLWAMYRTAQMYYEQQKFDLAEKYYTDCVDGQNRALGYSAPNTHRTFLELWNLYSQRRKFPEADALMARQLAGMRRDSATPLGVLGAFLAKSGNQRMQRGDLAVAEAAFRECLVISKKTQPNDWDTFAVQARLGKALLLQKKYEEAETMLLGAYEGLFDRQVSIPAGGRHNLTETILSLVDLYEASGNPAEAAHLLKPQLDALRRDRAADPLAVAAALTRYGRILEQLGLTPAAETALREALALGEKHGPETWATFHAKASLGGLLVGQNNFKAAEPLLLSGYEGMKWYAEKDSSPLNHSASEAVDRLSRLNAAAERLVELFQATNRPAEASKWRAELPAPAPQLAPHPRLVAPTK